MDITIRISSAYGQERIYPACTSSQIFADIAGTKTLSRVVIDDIVKLGYTVSVQQQIWPAGEVRYDNH